MYTSVHTAPRKHTKYVHVACDVIPDKVGHMYGLPNNPKAHVG